MVTTRIAVIKANLVDELRLRAGLADVLVLSAVPLSEADGRTEFIALVGDDSIEQDWSAIGIRSRDERVTLRGMVYVRRGGTGETVIRAIRERAVALSAEVEGYIGETTAQNRITVSGTPTVSSTLYRATGLAEDVEGMDRVAVLSFEVQCTTYLRGGA